MFIENFKQPKLLSQQQGEPCNNWDKLCKLAQGSMQNSFNQQKSDNCEATFQKMILAWNTRTWHKPDYSGIKLIISFLLVKIWDQINILPPKHV